MSAGQSTMSSTSALWPLWDAVRIVCIGRLMSSVEHVLSRGQYGRGGLLNYEPLRKLRYKSRTAAGRSAESLVDAVLLRQAGLILGLDAALSVVLEVRPGLWPAVLAAVVTQYLIMRRDLFSVEGADQMTLIVLLACGLGSSGGRRGPGGGVVPGGNDRAGLLCGGDLQGVRAAVGVRRGVVTIVATTSYGHPALRGALLRHRRLGTAASVVVLLWESAFPVSGWRRGWCSLAFW